MSKRRKELISADEVCDQSICLNSKSSHDSVFDATSFINNERKKTKKSESFQTKTGNFTIDTSSDEDKKSAYSDYDNESVCSGLEKVQELEMTTSDTIRISPKIITPNNFQNENEKSKTTRSQLDIYDRLLKSRIKLQPLLASINSLPQTSYFDQIKKDENCDIINHIDTVRTLLDQSIVTSKNIAESISLLITGQNIDLGHCENSNDFLEVLHTKMVNCRSSILQDWFDKTRLSAAKIPKKDFSNFEKSPVVQIEQIMSDSDRLIRRTHMNRSNTRAVGKDERDMTHNYVDDMKRDGTLYHFDPEIFDDSDFYQRQLSDFIKQRSDGSLDHSQTDGNYMTLRNQTQYKMDRPIDLRATKARKIKYTVIKKLAGLCAPADTSTWIDESMNELFGSLFGKSN